MRDPGVRFPGESSLVLRRIGCDGDEVRLFFSRDRATAPEYVLQLLGVQRYFLIQEAMEQPTTLHTTSPGSFAWNLSSDRMDGMHEIHLNLLEPSSTNVFRAIARDATLKPLLNPAGINFPG